MQSIFYISQEGEKVKLAPCRYAILSPRPNKDLETI